MSGDRHAMSIEFSQWIADAIHSRDLAASDLGDEAVLLPVWLWLVPRIDVGRKGHQGGQELLLPVRVAFAGGSVTSPETTSVTFSIAGLGHQSRGTAEITPDGRIHLGEDFGSHPVASVRAVGGVEQVVVAGKLAWWEILTQFEKMIRVYIPRVQSAVRGELSEFAGWDIPLLLGPTDVDVIVDRIILGEGNSTSRASRLIERCLDPTSFRRVDLVKYIATALRRDAEDEVRKRIGDPYSGRKIRLFAHQRGLSDPAAVLEQYTLAYPGEHMGLDRVQAALALASAPGASWTAVEKV